MDKLWTEMGKGGGGGGATVKRGAGVLQEVDTEDLFKKIVGQHEAYLKETDGNKKEKALLGMTGFVAQYLNKVRQDKKFALKETELVLQEGALKNAKFNAKEASRAFCNLAKYAENLLEQPWRTDFHVIKLIAGYYMHGIAPQLSTADKLLAVLGYLKTDEVTLKLICKQDASVLQAVSRDCYIASQECLIINQIWEFVRAKAPRYPVTLREIFELRQTHVGDTDAICTQLFAKIRAKLAPPSANFSPLKKTKVKESDLKVISSSEFYGSQRSPKLALITAPKEPWDCGFCTFLNFKDDRACEICSRPRSASQEKKRAEEKGTFNSLPKLYSEVCTGRPAGSRRTADDVLGTGNRPCRQCSMPIPVRARTCPICGRRQR